MFQNGLQSLPLLRSFCYDIIILRPKINANAANAASGGPRNTSRNICF